MKCKFQPSYASPLSPLISSAKVHFVGASLPPIFIASIPGRRERWEGEELKNKRRFSSSLVSAASHLLPFLSSAFLHLELHRSGMGDGGGVLHSPVYFETSSSFLCLFVEKET